jgi:MoaA/NifB/PqqE/SkfB family radical SAM enzyme
MPYLTSLCVLGIAEPFWKDAVFDVFEWVEFHRYRQNISFTTNTNGTCLHERTAIRFFDTVDFSHISWSLDAATPETFRKIRRLNAFDKIVDNLGKWVKMRERYGGTSSHRVSIYNNINLLNVHEMTAMVEMAADIGVDDMLMLPTYDQAGVVDLGELVLGPKNVDIFADAAAAARERASQLGLRLHYSKPFDQLPPPPPDTSETLEV